MNDLTRILSAIERGDPKAAEELLPLVYDELRKLAAQRLAREKLGQTLQATALVHEAYLRLLSNDSEPKWDSRAHFFAAAAEAMRRILIERARKRNRRDAIRGRPIPLDELVTAEDFRCDRILKLDDALHRLEIRKPLVAKLVKLRFFAGLSMEQAANALGMSLRTAERNWTYGRTWLYRELEKPEE